MVADSIANPICHIFNLSLEESLCPQARREAKVIPLPKSGEAVLLVLTADQSAGCQQLANGWKELCLTKYNAISL